MVGMGGGASGANAIELGNGNGTGERQIHTLPQKMEPVKVVPVPTSQAVYESKPVLRDLRREAAAFVPVAVKAAAVARKRGVGEAGGGGIVPVVSVVGEKGLGQGDQVGDLDRQLREEEERWRRETKKVTIEDVEDEND